MLQLPDWPLRIGEAMRALLIFLLMLSLTAPVAAGQLEVGMAAHDRGDYESAFRLWQPLAEQGDADAQTLLGIMYSEGRGVPQDDAAAAKWIRRAAEQGYADAQHLLGIMYGEGRGVLQDYAAAAKWYRRAAEQGNAGAQYNLGVMYYQGRGVPQDDAAAAKWYRLAAEQDYASAQRNLGVMYYNGQGVPQDYIQAHIWFNLAASEGDDKSREVRDLVAKIMTPDQIAEAQRLAREWKPTK
jgi:hypothetical protein